MQYFSQIRNPVTAATMIGVFSFAAYEAEHCVPHQSQPAMPRTGTGDHKYFRMAANFAQVHRDMASFND
jgi:hypothetical protein